LYGTQLGKVSFANNCLLARRLVERGVRFVQLYDQGWDHHGRVFDNLKKKCKQVDQPIAGLLKDLKQRGLLEETLVVWGAEFGRTPLLQSNGQFPGRDHHKEAFCIWMAGGGIQGGQAFGSTDELGYFPVNNPCHVNDWHATILHLLGVDHTKLTYKFQGRQFRLTDVGGQVLQPLIS
jgi:arylsulfatase A-like enzyme